MWKFPTSSHEITNGPYLSSNYENTGKTVTADLTTNYDAETNTSLAEKIKNVREHNFEGGANNSELDTATERNNVNSKMKPKIVYRTEPPWLNLTLKILIQNRQVALGRGDRAEFNHLRNLINRERKRCCAKYYECKVQHLKGCSPSKCPVFHRALPSYVSEDLERLQKRAMKIIYPEVSYAKALELSGLLTLYDRTEAIDISAKLFNEICENQSHSLHRLLPSKYQPG
ncbi:hypothetical protein AWC38_SpisGene20401 [Stylophora pistillata]|uniref:Uncharacterized protein n=1 Tax=Stylophora pistillata TaxID=50429 RepID=A0A2B4RGJ7_STYPI|nr:hypothetical protein AWC38_SpisGene20401 [Stylophora pistillata]